MLAIAWDLPPRPVLKTRVMILASHIVKVIRNDNSEYGLGFETHVPI